LSDTEKEENAENRMRYQFLAHQIDNYKSQQWSMTYYALLVFAGIIGITTILHKELCGVDYLIYLGIIIAILLTFILAFIIYMFWVYQKCLISNRRLTIELEEKFVTYEDIRKLPIPKRYFKYWFQGHILITFKLSIVLGYVFSMWYIFEKLIR